jgi:hypothetical protein
LNPLSENSVTELTPFSNCVIRAFAMCEAFGWTLDELGIAEEDKATFIAGFELILEARSQKAK